MNSVSTAMIQKQRPSHPNGSLLVSPHPKKGWESHIKIKTMSTVFLDWEGAFHHKYAPPGQTIRSTTSVSFVSWEMQYDENDSCYGQLVIGRFITATHPATHTSSRVQRFLTKQQIIQVTQLPFRPELAPCNFWLFPKLKSQGKRFQTVNEIQENMMGQLMAIGWLCEVPRLLLWRWLRHHCLMHNVSCILCLLQ